MSSEVSAGGEGGLATRGPGPMGRATWETARDDFWEAVVSFFWGEESWGRGRGVSSLKCLAGRLDSRATAVETFSLGEGGVFPLFLGFSVLRAPIESPTSLWGAFSGEGFCAPC